MFLYTVYQTTNILNGKKYIGVHRTKNLDDGYFGSGKWLLNAIKKYGRQNFIKEILFIFDNEKDMLLKEKELVNREFYLREDTYNLKEGADGYNGSGFEYINKNGLNNSSNQSVKGLQKIKELSKNPEWVANKRKNFLNSLLITPNYWNGKKHKEESKQKIGRANSLIQTGVGNSQYGKIWITNGLDNKLIKKEIDLIPEGWYKGRVIKKGS